jgi:tetratricopeptide (TPR) repeat protein
LFYEHVHLTFKGNYLLAKTVFEEIDQQLPPWIKTHAPKNHETLHESECARLMAYTPWDQYVITDEVILRFISKPPFTNQLYHQQYLKLWQQQRRALKANLTEEIIKQSVAQYQWAIQKTPEDLYLHWKYGRLLAEELHNPQAAAQQFQYVKRLIPHSYVMYNALGSIYLATGRMDIAEDHYLTALSIKPTCVDAHFYLGQIYQQRGESLKAIKHYSSAIQFLPNYVLAYNNLANVLYRQGKIDAAIEICRQGIQFVPDSALLHGSLGMLLHKQGQRDEAIKEIKRSLELDPNSQSRTTLEAVLKYTPH